MQLGFFAVSGEQIRAARALARIEQSELARLTSLSLQTIKRLESQRGPVDANVKTLNAVLLAFEGLGVVFKTTAAEVAVYRTQNAQSR